MSAYLIEVDDTKLGVCHPTVVGPFATDQEAQAFAEKYHMGDSIRYGEAGYSACHIVSDGTCDYSPGSFAEEHDEECECQDATDLSL